MIPGSYAIEKAVVIREPGRALRRFVVTYVKRYRATELCECLQELGWQAIATYDQEVGNHILCLFQRG